MRSPEKPALGPPGAVLAQLQQIESPQRVETPSPLEVRRWWHSRDYLPHFESSTAIQHITYRLADSLPVKVVTSLAAKLEQVPRSHREVERRKRIEMLMDSGHGSCVLQVPGIGEMVQSNLLFSDGDRYRLHAWVIMPNHVHVLIEPMTPWVVAKIVASWKAYTGRRISDWRILARAAPGGPGRASSVWHREYWDRYARNETHVAYFREYIHQNPVKAGLVRKAEDWPWSSANPGTARRRPG